MSASRIDGFSDKTNSGLLYNPDLLPATIKKGLGVFFLHGAVHLFPTKNGRTKKIVYKSSITVKNQIKNEIENLNFPLIVAEGDSKQKILKIDSNKYLRDCSFALISILSNPSAKLLIYGSALNKNDDHIFSKISNGKIETVFISIHGNKDLADNKKIIERAEKLKKLRTSAHRKNHPLEIIYFDAESVDLWGKHSDPTPKKQAVKKNQQKLEFQK